MALTPCPRNPCPCRKLSAVAFKAAAVAKVCRSRRMVDVMAPMKSGWWGKRGKGRVVGVRSGKNVVCIALNEIYRCCGCKIFVVYLLLGLGVKFGEGCFTGLFHFIIQSHR